MVDLLLDIFDFQEFGTCGSEGGSKEIGRSSIARVRLMIHQ
jgi:hypothetical protein